MTEKKKRGRPLKNKLKIEDAVMQPAPEGFKGIIPTIMESGFTPSNQSLTIEDLNNHLTAKEPREVKYQTTPMSNWALENRKKKLGLKD